MPVVNLQRNTGAGCQKHLPGGEISRSVAQGAETEEKVERRGRPILRLIFRDSTWRLHFTSHFEHGKILSKTAPFAPLVEGTSAQAAELVRLASRLHKGSVGSFERLFARSCG